MSHTNTEETEELIIKLLKKLERKGKNIQSFLWKVMDQFEDEQFDEKNDENELNINRNKMSLLFDNIDSNVCKFGHQIISVDQKHLSIEACILCGHRNNNNNPLNKIKPNNKDKLQFLNNYNINQVSFGPHKSQKRAIEGWLKNGKDKKWPLHYAAITGNIVQIKQLSQNKNIDIDAKKTNENDTTPIIFAARYGQLQSVIELIKNGANITPTPDKGNQTPYKVAVFMKHKPIMVFYKEYIKYLYKFEINKNTNLECYHCYNWDCNFNEHKMNGTMTKYVYCKDCTLENVQKVKKRQADNLVIERRIIKTIKQNPSISVDTLCQMKDVKSLHSILKEIMVSGQKHSYWLWLLDIDDFKAINTHLTHAIADTKIQALGQVLKHLETLTFRQWFYNGYDGINRIYAFRQGGDEFALVIYCNAQKINVLQKFYESLKDDISKIKLGKGIKLDNGKTMEHVTVSIGVCDGDRVSGYEEMMRKADECAETVKTGGKNGIAIYCPCFRRIYKNFNDIYVH